MARGPARRRVRQDSCMSTALNRYYYFLFVFSFFCREKSHCFGMATTIIIALLLLLSLLRTNMIKVS